MSLNDLWCAESNGYIYILFTFRSDRLCCLVVRVPGYTMEMYRVSCEVRSEFIYDM
jgi:hypothetical protein